MESNFYLVEIYRNIVARPQPDLKHKGSDTKKFDPSSPFLEKGFAETF